MSTGYIILLAIAALLFIFAVVQLVEAFRSGAADPDYDWGGKDGYHPWDEGW